MEMAWLCAVLWLTKMLLYKQHIWMYFSVQENLDWVHLFLLWTWHKENGDVRNYHDLWWLCFLQANIFQEKENWTDFQGISVLISMEASVIYPHMTIYKSSISCILLKVVFCFVFEVYFVFLLVIILTGMRQNHKAVSLFLFSWDLSMLYTFAKCLSDICNSYFEFYLLHSFLYLLIGLFFWYLNLVICICLLLIIFQMNRWERSFPLCVPSALSGNCFLCCVAF